MEDLVHKDCLTGLAALLNRFITHNKDQTIIAVAWVPQSLLDSTLAAISIIAQRHGLITSNDSHGVSG